VEDSKFQHLIRWNSNGGFLVMNPEEFSRDVLPLYFKHQNFSSFVRQLNMYGFHKISDFVSQNQEQTWEFSHPNFQKGKRELLYDIKRKGPTKVNPRTKGDKEQHELVEELNDKVEHLEGEVGKLQEANQAITNELLACKKFIREQRMAINQIIQYLGSSNATDASEGSLFSFLFHLFPSVSSNLTSQ